MTDNSRRGEAASAPAGIFRALATRNYRIWAGGALVSNVGTWMQRTAQYWLVMTELTPKNATAIGIVMSLQFGPQLLLLPLTGFTADHFERRKVLMVTQAVMGVLALGLGALTVMGLVELWHVYVCALLLGLATAFDSPARHTFVSELVGEEGLSNAVALNAASFNSARMIGPAVAGAVIAAVGSGWVFLVNAASFLAVLCSLTCLRVSELHPSHRAERSGGIAEGFRYVWGRSDLKSIFLMLFLIGTFGANFPIFITTMSVAVFQVGAEKYGILTSAMALGSVTGSLLAARRIRPQFRHLLIGSGLFGVGCLLSAVMPSYRLFAATLVIVGISAQTFTTSTNSLVQLTTERAMRGRVMAMLIAILTGGTPLGAPVVGWVADYWGPRWALGVGAASGFCAALVAIRYLAIHRGLRIARVGGRLRLILDDPTPKPGLCEAAPEMEVL